ncbi:MAG TPA: NAD(P)H dehydrogenase [Exiguobacterium sp.]|uniref:FMN dependent NADH:quinone oxidoreductase n=1 Tax=Exiguobacterium sibiricum (strain DSM 17290 / CCUG 55495 / CIP 109462 / JCM 13490 / 255-15) TaxID=262543 RepID=B1YHK7_EXIS2|nr:MULTISPECIES: FMN-dependent NADH-azoreductase [Exiguobacterium]ACB61180.1 NAD(P)H dehydrogenase (quinone) [Exiguobacterium sibiricum 255-15]HCN57920.1 NAD(P)H dehydrogenase [Exiguobacterium sp.]
MSRLLFIEANDSTHQKKGISSHMNEAFLSSYRTHHPEDEIVVLNLFEERLPFFDLRLASAAAKLFRGESVDPDDDVPIGKLQEYLTGFLDSDKIVFSFPMWNLTVPAPLHNYMDYLAQAGQTFRYTAEGSIGLVKGKQVLLLHSRGGDYSTSDKADSEHAVRYMLDILRFFGIEDVQTIILEGHQQYPDRADELTKKALSACEKAGETF